MSVNACSIKGDVKEHFSPCTGGADIFRDIQPPVYHGRRGLVWCPLVLGWYCSIAAGSSSWLRRRRQFLKRGKRCGCTVSTMVLSEARGLVLFRVVRGGIGFTQRLGARHRAYRRLAYSPSNPSVSRTDQPPPEKNKQRWTGFFTRDAQAACDFSLSASKPSPFFHRVSVIAAILRASVSRAIVGFMPFSSRVW